MEPTALFGTWKRMFGEPLNKTSNLDPHNENELSGTGAVLSGKDTEQ